MIDLNGTEAKEKVPLGGLVLLLGSKAKTITTLPKLLASVTELVLTTLVKGPDTVGNAAK